jgi:hypothetical protein
MRYLRDSLFVACLLVSIALGGTGGGGQSPVEEADGFVVVDPVRERSCIAVRVDVPAEQSIAGLRWFNGSSAQGFARVLAASGEDVVPPVYSEAMSLAENVIGLENGWSELTFNESVASLTGTLFVILQYPVDYLPVEGAIPLGVGYTAQEGAGHFLVSGNGDDWLQISKTCRLLLEPVYANRAPDVVAMGGASQGEESDEKVIPGELSLKSYPNPFNPEARFELNLPKTSMVSVKVFDLRGRLVRNLYGGEIAAGTTVLKWNGRDDQGRSASSGVYFAHMQVGQESLTNRLILLK